jgi:hypothetical protein
MYPRIPWELIAYPFGSAKHTFGTTGLIHSVTLPLALKVWNKTGSHSWFQQTKPALSLKIKERSTLLGINIIGSVRSRVALCLQITAFARACATAAYSDYTTDYFSSDPPST